MKYIKAYEESNTQRKQRIYNILGTVVEMLGGDIKIKDGVILRAYNKYYKIDRLFISNQNKLYVSVSTISKNSNKNTNIAYYWLSYSEMLKVIEYLKEEYPSQYNNIDIYDDTKKYNL